MVRLQLAKERADIRETLFGRQPEGGMFPRVGDLERLLRNQTEQPIVPRVSDVYAALPRPAKSSWSDEGG
jgi:hypothetical protein